MKRRLFASAVVSGLLCWIAFSHVERFEDSFIVVTDRGAYDPIGQVREWTNPLTRDCSSVSAVAPSSAGSRALALALSQAKGQDARLLSASRSGNWYEVEVGFPKLEPAIFLVEARGGKLTVHGAAAWSGSTGPLEPGPVIRKYLARQVPDAPQALPKCFEPTLEQFGHHK